MIRAIIIEDEPRGRNALVKMLEAFQHKVELVGTAENASTGRQLISELKPALVFLDIEMPHQNGFDMLADIPVRDFEIVFTTAYDQYAIKAFKFSATDYLLKPFEHDELEEAINKVETRIRNRQGSAGIDVLLQNIRQLSSRENKIALPTSDGLIFVETRNIIRCESDANYTRFFIEQSKPILVSKTLKEFEEMLEEYDFVRVHHSHLINTRHIKRYIKGEGGIAVMSDNSEVEISRRKKESFLNKLKQV